MQHLVIGTRGSALALWQTNWIKTRLEELHPGLRVEITIIKKLLGHRNLATTANYLHVCGERLAQIRSPLEFIYREPAAS